MGAPPAPENLDINFIRIGPTLGSFWYLRRLEGLLITAGNKLKNVRKPKFTQSCTILDAWILLPTYCKAPHSVQMT